MLKASLRLQENRVVVEEQPPSLAGGQGAWVGEESTQHPLTGHTWGLVSGGNRTQANITGRSLVISLEN